MHVLCDLYPIGLRPLEAVNGYMYIHMYVYI